MDGKEKTLIFTLTIYENNRGYSACAHNGEGDRIWKDAQIEERHGKDIPGLAKSVAEIWDFKPEDGLRIETIESSKFNTSTGEYKDPVSGKQRAEFYYWYMQHRKLG